LGGPIGGIYEKIFPERVVRPRAQEKWLSAYFNPKLMHPYLRARLHRSRVGSAGMRRNKDPSRNGKTYKIFDYIVV
jgi:hypothetical protein